MWCMMHILCYKYQYRPNSNTVKPVIAPVRVRHFVTLTQTCEHRCCNRVTIISHREIRICGHLPCLRFSPCASSSWKSARSSVYQEFVSYSGAATSFDCHQQLRVSVSMAQSNNYSALVLFCSILDNVSQKSTYITLMTHWTNKKFSKADRAAR